MESSTSSFMIIVWISRFILVGDLVLLFVDYCTMDAISLIEYVKVLHPDLLRGFDQFVPWECYKISHRYKISYGIVQRCMD